MADQRPDEARNRSTLLALRGAAVQLDGETVGTITGVDYAVGDLSDGTNPFVVTVKRLDGTERIVRDFKPTPTA